MAWNRVCVFHRWKLNLVRNVLIPCLILWCFCFRAWEVGTQNVTKAKYDRIWFWPQDSTHFGLWDSWISALALRYSNEPPSIPTVPTLAPASNVAVRVKDGSGGREGSYFAPITNSITPGDIRRHQNSSGKWAVRGRGKCVDGRERAIPFWQIAWTHHSRPFQSELQATCGE